MSTIASRVQEKWYAQGLRVVRPVDENSVDRSLSAAGLRVGADYVGFLSAVGGMESGVCDRHNWFLWNLEQVLVENEVHKTNGVYFADWLIGSHCHFVRRESETTSSVWVDYFDSTGGAKVADTLEDFLERYLAWDDSIGVYFDI